MIHYTLNTAHSRVSPRSEVRDEVVSFCRDYLSSGSYTDFPMKTFRLQVTIVESSLMATVWKSNVPLVSFAVAADGEDDDQIWDAIETQYLKITDYPGFRSADFEAPKKPKSAPWIAALVLAPLPDDAEWIADFERCFAWAFVEKMSET